MEDLTFLITIKFFVYKLILVIFSSRLLLFFFFSNYDIAGLSNFVYKNKSGTLNNNLER